MGASSCSPLFIAQIVRIGEAGQQRRGPHQQVRAAVAACAGPGAHQVDWSIGLPLAIGGLTTVSFGVALAHRLPERGLRLLFCGLLVITAVILVLAK
jgi:hypothetical protein